MYELFEQKYKECEKSMFLVAFGFLHNSEDAKDCVQESVLSALKSFPKLKNIDYFKTWITRIVINKSKDYLKKQRFSEELTDNLNVFYDMPTDEIGIIDCICKLKSKSSIYITLRFYNDMTYDEVAIAEYKIFDSKNNEIVKNKYSEGEGEKGTVCDGKVMIDLTLNDMKFMQGEEYTIVIEKFYGLAKADAPLHINGLWKCNFKC